MGEKYTGVVDEWGKPFEADDANIDYAKVPPSEEIYPEQRRDTDDEPTKEIPEDKE